MVRRILGSLFGRHTSTIKSADNEEDEQLALVFIPPLITILAAAEKSKGTPLSEAECIAIRDKSVCMSVRRSAADEMTRKRGYYDIIAEDVWSEWQFVRQTFPE